MATLATYTEEDKRLARQAGFKRKAPKKPKQSASLQTMENYIARWNLYVKDMKAKAKEAKTREKVKGQIRNQRR